MTIGTADEKLTANKDVEQRIIITGNAQEKDHHLIQQINTLSPGSRVLIFCSTKRMCVPGLAPLPHPTVHVHAHALTHTRTCR